MKSFCLALTHDVAEPTYVSFHSRSFDRLSRHSNVISNSYGELKGAGLLRTETFRSETAAISMMCECYGLNGCRRDDGSRCVIES